MPFRNCGNNGEAEPGVAGLRIVLLGGVPVSCAVSRFCELTSAMVRCCEYAKAYRSSSLSYFCFKSLQGCLFGLDPLFGIQTRLTARGFPSTAICSLRLSLRIIAGFYL